MSANPGEPLRPLARVASGGETSRLMLALKTVLGRADETPTLIFDEIDQGIGGRVGKAKSLLRHLFEKPDAMPDIAVHRHALETRSLGSPADEDDVKSFDGDRRLQGNFGLLLAHQVTDDDDDLRAAL